MVEKRRPVSAIKNDLKRGILIIVGFCDVLVLPGTRDFKRLYEWAGNRHKYSRKEKSAIRRAVMDAVRKLTSKDRDRTK